MAIRLERKPPMVETFIAWREREGWGKLELSTANVGLANGLFDVCAFDGDELVGFGRVVGDGALYFYIQDMIVRTSRQGEGIGGLILTDLLEQIEMNATAGAYVGLMAAAGREDFYKKYGFINRPNSRQGPGMNRFVR